MSDEPHIEYFHMGPWPVYVGFTMSKKAFAKEMRRLAVSDGPDFVATTHANATCHYLERDNTLTCILTMQKPKGRSVEQVAGLLAHEATHVAQQIWDHLGEKQPGAEAEAYLVQYLTQCCLQIALDTGRTKKTAP